MRNFQDTFETPKRSFSLHDTPVKRKRNRQICLEVLMVIQ